MVRQKFLVILVTSLSIYFVLDFVLNNAFLYLVSGVVGGSISLAFKAIGIKASTNLVGLAWLFILSGTVFVFFYTSNKTVKHILLVVIALLLYILDFFVANIPYSGTTDSFSMIPNLIIGLLVFVKSMILTWIIQLGFNK